MWFTKRFGRRTETVNRPHKWGRYTIGVERRRYRSSRCRAPPAVEIIFARLGIHGRMSKDYAYLKQSSEAFIYTAVIRPVLRRLAATHQISGFRSHFRPGDGGALLAAAQ